MVINSAKIFWQLKKKAKLTSFFYSFYYIRKCIYLYFEGTQALAGSVSSNSNFQHHFSHLNHNSD
jgi:hypothetical protein